MQLRSLPARAWRHTIDLSNRLRVPLAGHRRGLGDIMEATIAGVSRDNTSSFARSIAFSWLLAIFPLIVLAVTALGLFHASGMLNAALEQGRGAMPPDAYRLMADTIIPRLTNGTHDARLGIGAAASISIALWGVSGAMREVMNALNVMHGVRETRGRVRTYAWSLVLALGAALLVVTATTLLVVGPRIASVVAAQAGMGDSFTRVWAIARWPVLVLLVLLAFSLVYRFAPNVDRRWRVVSPGSVAAFVGWLGFTWLFRLYVTTFGTYSHTYGALAGVIVLMLYLSWSSFIVLLGAEVDRAIEEIGCDRSVRESDEQS